MTTLPIAPPCNNPYDFEKLANSAKSVVVFWCPKVPNGGGQSSNGKGKPSGQSKPTRNPEELSQNLSKLARDFGLTKGTQGHLEEIIEVLDLAAKSPIALEPEPEPEPEPEQKDHTIITKLPETVKSLVAKTGTEGSLSLGLWSKKEQQQNNGEKVSTGTDGFGIKLSLELNFVTEFTGAFNNGFWDEFWAAINDYYIDAGQESIWLEVHQDHRVLCYLYEWEGGDPTFTPKLSPVSWTMQVTNGNNNWLSHITRLRKQLEKAEMSPKLKSQVLKPEFGSLKFGDGLGATFKNQDDNLVVMVAGRARFLFEPAFRCVLEYPNDPVSGIDSPEPTEESFGISHTEEPEKAEEPILLSVEGDGSSSRHVRYALFQEFPTTPDVHACVCGKDFPKHPASEFAEEDIANLRDRPAAVTWMQGYYSKPYSLQKHWHTVCQPYFYYADNPGDLISSPRDADADERARKCAENAWAELMNGFFMGYKPC